MYFINNEQIDANNLSAKLDFWDRLFESNKDKSLVTTIATLNSLNVDCHTLWDLRRMTAEDLLRELLVGKLLSSLKGSTRKTAVRYAREHHTANVLQVSMHVLNDVPL